MIEFESKYWPLCHENWDDIETQKGFNFKPVWESLDDYIKVFSKNKYQFNKLIENKITRRICGHITVSPNVEFPDIALWIFKDFKGKGIGKKALQLALKEFGKTAQKDYLYAGIYPDNKVSIHLFKTMGFEETGNGEFERDVFSGGQTYQILFRKRIK